MSIRRKNIRLSAPSYIGKRLYFLTICCQDRRPVFGDGTLGNWLLANLSTIATEQNFSLHAYCVMLNHVHLLVEGKEPSSNAVRFVALLKQKTEFDYRRQFHHRLWQPKYYDHVLRTPEQVTAVAWYIWLNPVRKGLCNNPYDYPLSGSFTSDWKRHCVPANLWSPPWKKCSDGSSSLPL
jgi:REP element-mobilizing transposase RayT